ncbi:MAG: hypothetical protein R2762_23565 [Bryobacteraceae bacterium]
MRIATAAALCLLEAAAQQPIPKLGSTSASLRPLASQKRLEDKCAVLLEWLQSSGVPAAQARYGIRPGANVFAPFADEPMTQVFGAPYDRLEPKHLADIYNKVVLRCAGAPMPPPRFQGGFRRGPSRELQSFAEAFNGYQMLLGQAFTVEQRAVEPTAIREHLRTLREQMQWAQKALSAAASGPGEQVYRQIESDEVALKSQMALLSWEDREAVRNYLAARKSQIAPDLVQAWLERSRNAPKNLESAGMLSRERAAIDPAMLLLADQPRQTAETEYQTLLEACLRDGLAAEESKLPGIPASLEGLKVLRAWKDNFDTNFAPFALKSVEAAGQVFERHRARVIAGALPEWSRQIEALPLEPGSVTASQGEIQRLFFSGPRERLSGWGEFQAPVRALEARIKAAENAQKALREIEFLSRRRDDILAGKALYYASFRTAGMGNAKLFRAIFNGQFEGLEMARDDDRFISLMSSYMRVFDQKCSQHLPGDARQVTSPVCTETTRQTTFRGATPLFWRDYCSLWGEQNEYRADPRLYEPYAELRRESISSAFSGDLLTNFVNAINSVRTGKAAQTAGEMMSVLRDMHRLIPENGCTSPGLQRFQENMRRFAAKEPAIPLEGPTEPASASLPSQTPAVDFARLLDDLVTANAKSWMVNRYVPGSIRDAEVQTDERGAVAAANAMYTYQSLGGPMNGNVRLSFKEGVPQCLYFWDKPTVCAPPDSQVTTALRSGAYKK